MATTGSPTTRLPLEPRGSAFADEGVLCTSSTARSVVSSASRTFACSCVWSASVTLTVESLPTTCAFVRRWPWPSMRKPVPRPSLERTSTTPGDAFLTIACTLSVAPTPDGNDGDALPEPEVDGAGVAGVAGGEASGATVWRTTVVVERQPGLQLAAMT